MGADDDADCVEHVWELAEINATADGADQVEECLRCPAVRYSPSMAGLRPEI